MSAFKAEHVTSASTLYGHKHCTVAGTYVRFQPRSAGFQEHVGDGVEQVLQAAMFTHSTLTEGEWVQVSHGGAQHDLKVLALKPESAVSVIGELRLHDCVPWHWQEHAMLLCDIVCQFVQSNKHVSFF